MNHEGTIRKVYEGGATFIPVCPICNRFVKADASIFINGMGELSDQPNTTCSKHGRVNMQFEEYV